MLKYIDKRNFINFRYDLSSKHQRARINLISIVHLSLRNQIIVKNWFARVISSIFAPVTFVSPCIIGIVTLIATPVVGCFIIFLWIVFNIVNNLLNSNLVLDSIHNFRSWFHWRIFYYSHTIYDKRLVRQTCFCLNRQWFKYRLN